MTQPFIQAMLDSLPQTEGSMDPKAILTEGDGELPSWFAVSDLAVASIGTAGVMLAHFAGHDRPEAVVDRRLASLWFGMTLRPIGWAVPSPWDAIAGDYRTRDGWIRLHTNAPHHRTAALSVLGDHADRAALEPAVAKWDADDLETEIVEAGGCAATMRDIAAWQEHPQGVAVSKDPLIIWRDFDRIDPLLIPPNLSRPLGGVKVLDLTRVLAGPVASRFLAAFGANVLRIDPPDWDEPGVIPEVTPGKRCAGLNLKDHDDRKVFKFLLSDADVLLHGYRSGALDNLGLDAAGLRRINPALIDVSLNAYGWSGPWSGRRGFDSLVQMSCGIASHGMTISGTDRPVPLPVQALDHATGYLLAAAVLDALHQRAQSGHVFSARLSLARMAQLLSATSRPDQGSGIAAETENDIDTRIEQTHWGPARRVKFPVRIGDFKPAWDYPAGKLRSSRPAW